MSYSSLSWTIPSQRNISVWLIVLALIPVFFAGKVSSYPHPYFIVGMIDEWISNGSIMHNGPTIVSARKLITSHLKHLRALKRTLTLRYNVDVIFFYNIAHELRVIGIPDNKVHGANMGPTWVLLAPDGPHFGPMNLAIRDVFYYILLPSVSLITTEEVIGVCCYNRLVK